jgi:hypothetical protein
MLILWNGQRSPVGGWFEDEHGHRLYLRKGDPAPICPRFGPTLVRWRVVQVFDR